MASSTKKGSGRHIKPNTQTDERPTPQQKPEDPRSSSKSLSATKSESPYGSPTLPNYMLSSQQGSKDASVGENTPARHKPVQNVAPGVENYGPRLGSVSQAHIPSRQAFTVGDPRSVALFAPGQGMPPQTHPSSQHDDGKTSLADRASPVFRHGSVPQRNPQAHHEHLERNMAAMGPRPTAQAASPLMQTQAAGYTAKITEGKATLSPLAQDFARIEYLNFKDCGRFIGDHPEILKENKNAFLDEAYQAYCRDEAGFAESCIQQGVLIDECALLSEDGIRSYMKDLKERQASATKPFFVKFDLLQSYIKDRFDRTPRPPPAQVEPTTKAYKHARSDPAQQSTPSDAQKIPLPYQYRNPASQVPSTAIDGMALRGTSAPHLYVSAAPMDVFHVPAGKRDASVVKAVESRDPNIGISSTGSQHEPSTIRTNLPIEKNPKVTNRNIPTVELAKVDIKGTKGEKETLNPNYKKRFDAVKFFKVGRVFAILWHENAGTSQEKEDKGEDLGPVAYITKNKSTKGRFSEEIFSHIRRMVVVRQRHGYCWCIPINTYGGGGVKKNMSPNEIEAHTIIYESDGEPVRLETEPEMTKDPIAVVMAKKQTLDKASRLNFAKVHTVEWNVKVMDIGKVSDGSMAQLEAYWYNEMIGQPGPH